MKPDTVETTGILVVFILVGLIVLSMIFLPNWWKFSEKVEYLPIYKEEIIIERVGNTVTLYVPGQAVSTHAMEYMDFGILISVCFSYDDVIETRLLIIENVKFKDIRIVTREKKGISNVLAKSD